MRSTTVRIPPLPEAEWSDEVRELLPKGRKPLNIFTTLVRHPQLFKRWMVFGGHILSKSTLSPRDRELLILRTGYRCKSPYEFHQHTRIGLQSGLTSDEIQRLQQPQLLDNGWTEHDTLLLEAADELHDDFMISDKTWQKLRAQYSDKQIFDLLFTVGQYTLVSMFLNSVGVPIEEAQPEVPTT
jgi:4-carboxymuconolactone decarboxylase